MRYQAIMMSEQPIDLRTQPLEAAAGEVIEVLPVFGVVHVRTVDGRLLGLNRKTPGVRFETLATSQRVRLVVEQRFMRVTHIDLLP